MILNHLYCKILILIFYYDKTVDYYYDYYFDYHNLYLVWNLVLNSWMWKNRGLQEAYQIEKVWYDELKEEYLVKAFLWVLLKNEIPWLLLWIALKKRVRRRFEIVELDMRMTVVMGMKMIVVMGMMKIAVMGMKMIVVMDMMMTVEKDKRMTVEKDKKKIEVK